MARNLTNLYISQSFEYLVQLSASAFETGLGVAIPSINITASNAVSSSYAVTASFALNGGGGTVSTASLLTTASATNNVITFTKGDASTFNVTVATGSASTTPTGSLLTTASAVDNIITFTKGDGSTFPVTIATGSAVSASFATTASLALLNVLTASSTNDTITYTKGNGTTFTNVINNVANASTASIATSASYALTASFALNGGGGSTDTGSLLTTASVSNATTTFTKGNGTTFAVTVNNVVNANSASVANTAISSSFATNANTATSASYALNATSASYTPNAVTTASVSSNIITFTKGDGSTFPVTVATGSAVTVDTGSLMKTGSVNSNVLTFTKGDGSTFNLTVNTGSAAAIPTLDQVLTAGSSSAIIPLLSNGIRVGNTEYRSDRIVNGFAGEDFSITAGTANTAKLTLTGTGGRANIGIEDYNISISGSTSVSGSLIVTSGITGSLQGTASFATQALSASNALTSTSASYSNTSTSASYSATATSSSYAINATSASYTPNAVTTASVSLNTITFTKGDGTTFPVTVDTGSGGGGVAFPYTGSAQITGSLGVTGSITATNGFTGSLQGTASYAISASYVDFGTSNGTAFTASTTWNYNHNLGTQLITVDTYDSNYEEIIPQNIDLTDDFNAVITFPIAVAGYAVASLGNGVSSVTNNITNSINNITQSISNSYFDVSPSSLSSNQQTELFSGTASYTTTINAVGNYSIHVSQSGTYFINATGLTALSASVNCYYYPELFPTSSMAILALQIQSGSGTNLILRSLVSASSTYEWWYNSTSAIGGSNTSISRNASRKTFQFPAASANPSVIYKNSQGLVQLAIPAQYLGNATTLYSHTGSEGTALV